MQEGKEIISKKKEHYPTNDALNLYLKKYGRSIELPVSYSDLIRFDNSLSVFDKEGKDTLWVSALYSPYETETLFDGLKKTYSILKSGGDFSVHEHLHIERIDYCTFGNSHPFRIKIVNNYNDVYDYFYIKKADASRVFGLELEHILSPSRINFFSDKDTLVEEHIAGIPGDMFIEQYLNNTAFNKKRIAKEFVKFNERCFVRLLGDMRSYNYVFDITPDFEDTQFRIRAIDFDQQSYEGRKNLYMPQFFKENLKLVELVKEHFNHEVVTQYQSEERTLISRRIISSKYRLDELLDAAETISLAPQEKIKSLNKEIEQHFDLKENIEIKSMAQIVRRMLEHIIS
jgi:hypothetical protein